jgi:type VI secretion system secreted protein Hcp
MAIYMKVEGSKKIEGPVTTQGFAKQIELTRCDFRASRTVSTASRSEQKRTHAEAFLEEIRVSKAWDATSSSKLFEAVASGTADLKVTITFTSADESGPLTFLVIELEKCAFTFYDLRAEAGETGSQPTEDLAINYTKFTMTPSTVDSDKKPQKGSVVSHDMLTGKTG